VAGILLRPRRRHPVGQHGPLVRVDSHFPLPWFALTGMQAGYCSFNGARVPAAPATWTPTSSKRRLRTRACRALQPSGITLPHLSVSGSTFLSVVIRLRPYAADLTAWPFAHCTRLDCPCAPHYLHPTYPHAHTYRALRPRGMFVPAFPAIYIRSGGSPTIWPLPWLWLVAPRRGGGDHSTAGFPLALPFNL